MGIKENEKGEIEFKVSYVVAPATVGL